MPPGLILSSAATSRTTCSITLWLSCLPIHTILITSCLYYFPLITHGFLKTVSSLKIFYLLTCAYLQENMCDRVGRRFEHVPL